MTRRIEVWEVTKEALKEINELRERLCLGESKLKIGDELKVLIK